MPVYYQRLVRLAELYGVQPSYTNLAGEVVEASTEALLRVLQALGAPVNRLEDAEEALNLALKARCEQIVEPVVVTWSRTDISVCQMAPAAASRQRDSSLIPHPSSLRTPPFHPPASGGRKMAFPSHLWSGEPAFPPYLQSGEPAFPPYLQSGVPAFPPYLQSGEPAFPPYLQSGEPAFPPRLRGGARGGVTIPLLIPQSAANSHFKATLSFDNGEQSAFSSRFSELTQTGSIAHNNQVFHNLLLVLNNPLSYGYHHLRIEFADQTAKTLIIAAPCRAYRFDDDDANSKFQNSWGVFAPFYAIHNERTLGVGDIGAAMELLDWSAKLGSRMFATLPLLPTYLHEPCHPSPYWPISRLFWNELFIDVEQSPELAASPKARKIVNTADFRMEKNFLRSLEYIDYKRVAALKRKALEACAETFFETHPTVKEQEILAEGGAELAKYAMFRAVQDRAGQVWRHWDDRLQKQELNTSDYDVKNYRYHLYVQHIIKKQIGELAARGYTLEQPLYLDLPVGVHPYGFDTWHYKDQFTFGATVGAPPDPLAPQGQEWGFPPLHPHAIRQSGYDYFIRFLRHHLEVCGCLRIDHIMGLHRLFCVPENQPASQGVYVSYKSNELYAILCLESHRFKCEIIGEDLGTVPDYVRAEMDKRGLRRLYVLPFEAKPDPKIALNPIPAGAVASLNTHDMHPFRAFWNGYDITDMVRQGINNANISDDNDDDIKKRKILVEAIERYIIESHFQDCPGIQVPGCRSSAVDSETNVALDHCLQFLARSRTGIMLVNLEDLWNEIEPQNRPGTLDKRNWAHRFKLSLVEIVASDSITNLLKTINTIRQKQGNKVMPTKKSTAVRKTVKSKAQIEPSSAPIGSSAPRFFLTHDDLYLFNEGTHYNLWEKLGSHIVETDGRSGCRFAVWAPDAVAVNVVGDFNGWRRASHPLYPNGQSGIWEGFIAGVNQRMIYKYYIRSRYSDFATEKADPFAVHTETPPKTGSIVWQLDYKWKDKDWMSRRAERNRRGAPISIYELHIGSWRRVPEQMNRPLTYCEMAELLPDYLLKMGFTHVQFLPVMEHPFYGSWGYQTVNYFAPTSRYGTPQDLMRLIDALHQAGIGVILDWVPSHFPADEYALYKFDGTHLYEHADARKGLHPDWDSAIFNYGRNEVRAFLISSALYWLNCYHIDGLRLDAVASMLYLDYSREPGEWLTNKYGGRENIEAIDFLRQLNTQIYAAFPDVQTIAEESTAWPMVSRPTHLGGLGFGFKWDMGWMHDTLDYITKDPVFRRFHHNALTFRMLYAFHENFVLPLSHDEVVHGKASLLSKMPGDEWRKFANLRLLYTYLYTAAGKKLLFMGGEIAQWNEWNHDTSLDWHLLQYEPHLGIQKLVADLNRLYQREPALHEMDNEPAGFEWVDCNDADSSAISFLRWSKDWRECCLIVLNFTPALRHHYLVGVPCGGVWRELFNSDAEYYGGSGQGNMGLKIATGRPFHGRLDSLDLILPPLGGVIFKYKDE
ncbi:MAG: 1,4-alpha-glucan branching protein GlgB [Calditrichaeota bacterium]|nr:1,4-alpha-glucan branching protein GlgB [Calditrichota bacterium]